MIDRLDSTGARLALDAQGLDGLRRSARENAPEALQEAAKQFEALFMNMLMKSMREATPQDGFFDNDQTRMYTSMLDQQLSQTMASRGVGLADVLVRQLSATFASGVPVQGAAAELTARTPFAADAAPGPSPLSSATAAATWMAAMSDKVQSARGESSQPEHVRQFQQRMMPHAEEASRSTGIPARFILAQAALESGWGRHEIGGADGSNSFNLFGIKATGGWKGRTVDVTTTEYVDGVPEKRVEKFRAYGSYAEAFRDYASLLSNNSRYQHVIANSRDAQSFASGLQRAGYATDPQYAAKLTHIINNALSG